MEPTDFEGNADVILFFMPKDPFYEFNNFSPHPITYQSLTYATVEHLFQAQKFRVNSSLPELANEIRQAPTPEDALRLATIYRPQQRPDWFDVNRSFMCHALNLKFTQHPHLGDLLESTGNKLLVENSPIDSFWGIGADGKGKNELGMCLMATRAALREQRVRHGNRVFTPRALHKISGASTSKLVLEKKVGDDAAELIGRRLDSKAEIAHYEVAPPRVLTELY